nr:MAG TPA: hypothetical protein [Caudoviricetes sp.]
MPEMPEIPWSYCECEYLEGQLCEHCSTGESE